MNILIIFFQGNSKNSEHVTLIERTSLNLDCNTTSSINNSFQLSLYSGMHYFLYLNVFLNQNIVNDDHLNISSDNLPNLCSENSSSITPLDDNSLTAKPSPFVFFDFVSSN